MNIPQGYESWKDEESQDILPSFEQKEQARLRRVWSHRVAMIGRGLGTVAFILAITAALIEGWWIWAMFLSGMFVMYQKSFE